MYARLSRFAGLPPERIDPTIREFEQRQLPQIEQMEGFGGVIVGVNREEGKALAVTFWETRQDLRASDKLADQARDVAIASAQPSRDPIVDRYELVIRR